MRPGGSARRVAPRRERRRLQRGDEVVHLRGGQHVPLVLEHQQQRPLEVRLGQVAVARRVDVVERLPTLGRCSTHLHMSKASRRCSGTPAVSICGGGGMWHVVRGAVILVAMMMMMNDDDHDTK